MAEVPPIIVIPWLLNHLYATSNILTTKLGIREQKRLKITNYWVYFFRLLGGIDEFEEKIRKEEEAKKELVRAEEERRQEITQKTRSRLTKLLDKKRAEAQHELAK